MDTSIPRLIKYILGVQTCGIPVWVKKRYWVIYVIAYAFWLILFPKLRAETKKSNYFDKAVSLG